MMIVPSPFCAVTVIFSFVDPKVNTLEAPFNQRKERIQSQGI
jgi:hypothetical protein